MDNESQPYTQIENQNLNKNVKFLQINLQTHKAAINRLNRFIDEKNIDIVLTQEPYVLNQKVCRFSSDYRIFQTSNANESPRASIIVINPSIQATGIQTFTNEFVAVVQIQTSNETILLLSLYCSPNEDLEPKLEYTENIIRKLKPKNLIICTDANAHSKYWFNHFEDQRGQIFQDFIAINNLIIINDNEDILTYYTT
jgi:exonuclease III